MYSMYCKREIFAGAKFHDMLSGSSEEVFAAFIFAEWMHDVWPHPYQLMAIPHMQTEEMTLTQQ